MHLLHGCIMYTILTKNGVFNNFGTIKKLELIYFLIIDSLILLISNFKLFFPETVFTNYC